MLRRLLPFLVGLTALSMVPAPATAEWVQVGPPKDGAPAWQVQVTEHDGLTTVRLSVSGFERVPLHQGQSRFESILLPGAGSLRVAGRPSLPVVAIPLLLSGDTEIVQVRSQVRTFADSYPSPFAARPKRCGPTDGWRLTCEASVYESSQPYPEEAVRFRQNGRIRSSHVVMLEVRPFRFFPSKRLLEVAWETEIDLAGYLHRQGDPRYESEAFRKLEIEGFFSAMSPDEREDFQPEGLLVIAHDDLLDPLVSFVAWKRQAGLEVSVLPLSQVGDSEKAVQEAIAEAYFEWDNPPTYVLLVGDGDPPAVVPFVESPYGCASDFLYSTIDGDDLYSDLFVGRISAHTPAEAQLQLAKAVWYESDVESAGLSSWIPRSLCISSSEGEGESNDDFRSDIICSVQQAHGYAPTDKLYHSKGNDTAGNISTKIEEGRGWLTYLGHGSGHDWSTTVPPYSVTHVQELQNVFMLPFIVDISCSNGGFASPSDDCFAEAWLKTGMPGFPTAAVAIYSASTPTPWDEPAEMAIGMTQAVLEGTAVRWGVAAAAGRAHMMKTLPDGEIEEVCHQYVVFSDPSLLLRTQAAQPLEVLHPEAIELGGSDLAVQVQQAGVPVEGASVTLEMPDGAFIVAKTDPAGTAALWVEALVAGELKLTVMAANSIPYSATVEILLSGCAVLQAKPAVLGCDGTAGVNLFDTDLDVKLGEKDTAVVTAHSESFPVAKNFVLTETANHSGHFVGTVELSVQPGQFQVGVSHGDLVEIAYGDETCEQGAGTKSAKVEVDCQAPVISAVQFMDVEALSARLVFQTDEPASGLARVGSAIPPDKEVGYPVGADHELFLGQLAPLTKYFVEVEAQDAAGNSVKDDKGGSYYSFVTAACSPDCEGKSCGDDGCGGACGDCCDGQTCQDGLCLGGPGCEIGEGPGCGGCDCEDCVCDQDPYCCMVTWDDLCVLQCLTGCGGCGGGPNCEGKECGSDGCGGVCGTCPAEWTCTDEGKCVEHCESACQDKECGGDGCGGACGTCAEGAKCQDGQCLEPCVEVDFVGCCDGNVHVYCDEGFQLSLDCSKEGLVCGWKASLAWYDCVEEQLQDPTGQHPLWCPWTCIPECQGKECGPDGCQGVCGKCGLEESCNNGQCEPLCKPQCENRVCGDDQCGNVCGSCALGQTCQQGQCVQVCTPECHDKQCGDNGCGGTCGNCAPGMECSAASQCVVKQEGPEDVVAAEPVESETVIAQGDSDDGCSASRTAASAAPLWLWLWLWLLATLVLRPRRWGLGYSYGGADEESSDKQVA
jgi:hypothetical protein